MLLIDLFRFSSHSAFSSSIFFSFYENQRTKFPPCFLSSLSGFLPDLSTLPNVLKYPVDLSHSGSSHRFPSYNFQFGPSSTCPCFIHSFYYMVKLLQLFRVPISALKTVSDIIPSSSYLNSSKNFMSIQHIIFWVVIPCSLEEVCTRRLFFLLSPPQIFIDVV